MYPICLIKFGFTKTFVTSVFAIALLYLKIIMVSSAISQSNDVKDLSNQVPGESVIAAERNVSTKDRHYSAFHYSQGNVLVE
jgi:hypothetical protein